MNYTGGKYKILNYIIPTFHDEINSFVDLFAGGLNVGINIDANTIYVNDRISYVIDLYRYFRDNNTDTIIAEIKSRIKEHCLSNANQDSYHAFRDHYNETKDILDLFILSCFSYNHQIRFNNDLQFNATFGLRSYNDSIEENLIRFCDALHKKNYVFSHYDFRQFNYQCLKREDIVYCDPPYLISLASYNDGTRGFGNWTKQDDKDLFNILDDLNSNGIQFALSNVTHHRGLVNEELIKFGNKYNVTEVNKQYIDCSHNLKDRWAKTVEVLITNYDVGIKPVKRNKLF